MTPTPDLMLDMETLDNGPRPVVLSVALVPFYPWGAGPAMTEDGSGFVTPYHRHIRPDGQTDRGLTVSIETMNWWRNQSQAAFDRVFHPEVSTRPDTAIIEIKGYLAKFPDAEVWSYGAGSDLVWLRSLFNAYGYPDPVHYRNHNCLRTLAKLTGSGVPADYNLPGQVEHDALEDCYRQVRLAQAAARHLERCSESSSERVEK